MKSIICYCVTHCHGGFTLGGRHTPPNLEDLAGRFRRLRRLADLAETLPPSARCPSCGTTACAPIPPSWVDDRFAAREADRAEHRNDQCATRLAATAHAAHERISTSAGNRCQFRLVAPQPRLQATADPKQPASMAGGSTIGDLDQELKIVLSMIA